MNPLEFDQKKIEKYSLTVKSAFSSCADAEDVSQFMKMKIFEYDEGEIPGEVPEDKRQTYAMVAAKNKAHNEFGSRRWCNSTRSAIEHIGLSEATGLLSEDEYEDIEDRMDEEKLIRDCLDFLSGTRRELFLRYYVKGESAAEIGVALGWSPASVRSEKSKMIRDLKQRLGGRDD